MVQMQQKERYLDGRQVLPPLDLDWFGIDVVLVHWVELQLCWEGQHTWAALQLACALERIAELIVRLPLNPMVERYSVDHDGVGDGILPFVVGVTFLLVAVDLVLWRPIAELNPAVLLRLGAMDSPLLLLLAA